MRLAALLLVFAVACSPHHDPAAQPIASSACVTCHQADYADTTDLDHVAFGFPQTCGDCHTTTAWTPAQNDHPEATFPITVTPHDVDMAGTPMRCNECHNFTLGPATGTGNADCITCHTRAETDPLHPTTVAPSYAWVTTPRSFCLTCHPTGSGSASSH